MNFLLASYLKHFGKIKIVHSIKGRMRVNIPAPGVDAKIVAPYIDELKKEMQRLKGIKSVEYSPETGNALIFYDPKILPEAELGAWLENVWARSIDLLAALPQNQIENPKLVLPQLKKILSELSKKK